MAWVMGGVDGLGVLDGVEEETSTAVVCRLELPEVGWSWRGSARGLKGGDGKGGCPAGCWDRLRACRSGTGEGRYPPRATCGGPQIWMMGDWQGKYTNYLASASDLCPGSEVRMRATCSVCSPSDMVPGSQWWVCAGRRTMS